MLVAVPVVIVGRSDQAVLARDSKRDPAFWNMPPECAATRGTVGVGVVMAVEEKEEGVASADEKVVGPPIVVPSV
ncbi:hypothetical protein B0H65DRAFT_551729 [Neurospora tetraspora]|uniref:Uncharacterized protein n=1 Tax=Neurospora tetraspora TaxID=94610 RepID=A0AAE0MNR2_9PEZI|nr:hypothetical protein B0H65DRAFT_551729 [Neurospora tetraspora]